MNENEDRMKQFTFEVNSLINYLVCELSHSSKLVELYTNRSDEADSDISLNNEAYNELLDTVRRVSSKASQLESKVCNSRGNY